MHELGKKIERINTVEKNSNWGLQFYFSVVLGLGDCFSFPKLKELLRKKRFRGNAGFWTIIGKVKKTCKPFNGPVYIRSKKTALETKTTFYPSPYGVLFSTKKCALYFKKCNFVFVS